MSKTYPLDPTWKVEDEQGQVVKMVGPRAFRHTLSGVINPLAGLGFDLLRLWEEVAAEYIGDVALNPASGTWEHFIRVVPLWLTVWSKKKSV